MPLDGLFVHKLVEEISFLETGRINKINQISPTDLVMQIRSNGSNYSLFVSIHPEFYRLNITSKSYDNDKSILNFTILLRKYLEGGIIKKISQFDNDRIITLNINKNNEIGDKMDVFLHIELMGRHSNMILCIDNVIVSAYRLIHPFENTNRTVLPNSIYYNDKSKLNPYDLTLDELKNEFNSISSPKDLTSKFNGISLFVANYAYNNYQLFFNIINSCVPTIYESNYYFNDISYIDETKTHFNTLSELLDNYYFEKSKSLQNKVKSHNLLHTIKNKIEKQEKKLSKLNEEYEEALDNEIYKIKGELLFANIDKIIPGSTSIIVDNYYTNEPLEIELSNTLSPKKNANKYYTIYSKKKKALLALPIQIELTKDEIKYYRILESQISVGNYEDILGITNELNGKVKKEKVKISTYKAEDYTIYIGKNNTQNSHLIKEIAQSSDLWFHVWNAPSSHIVLSGVVNEESIRLCANLAAYYSKYRYSSSVPIIYTKIKNLKRIPGKKNCFVSYSNEKTIYIDPDIPYIEGLNIK